MRLNRRLVEGGRMFEETLRALRSLDGKVTISVPVEADEKGFLDKECPSDDCTFAFKVNAEDWRALFRDEAVFCPRCRHEATANRWWTTEQVEHVREQGVNKVRGLLRTALEKDARQFNARQSKKSFIRMSMGVSGPTAPTCILPAKAAEALQLEVVCESCSARFAVLGPAYFCPCCGNDSVDRSFDLSLTKILAKVDNLDLIVDALARVGKKDEAAHTTLSLVESGIQDCVTAFQRLCEMRHSAGPGTNPPPKNAFQRLGSGSDIWNSAIGFKYELALEASELAELEILFQKRHLLAHQDGVVDAEYLKKSGDCTYRLGQRIVVKQADVRRMVALVSKLTLALREAFDAHSRSMGVKVG